ncbi:MAG: hypothetical protein IPM54_08030 [Polyangiaceae bacterium]|nr:hypothetical protein [Polyangiaceae bacterium]
MPIQIEAAQAYDKFLPVALTIAAADILPYRIDAALAITNVREAMPVLLAKEHLLAEHLPKVNAALLLALPDIALATEYAALKAEHALPTEKLMRQKLAEGWQLRALLLGSAKVLASAGFVTAQEVDAIAEGRGQRDMARDCVMLADLFRKYESTIAGKHPVDKTQIDDAAAVGSWLSANLRTTNALPASSTSSSPEAEARDRMGTLLVQQYNVLETVLHYFYGKNWDALIPSLQSRAIKRETPAEVK